MVYYIVIIGLLPETLKNKRTILEYINVYSLMERLMYYTSTPYFL
jgi:hypothetical protein